MLTIRVFCAKKSFAVRRKIRSQKIFQLSGHLGVTDLFQRFMLLHEAHHHVVKIGSGFADDVALVSSQAHPFGILRPLFFSFSKSGE
ncbi:MAG: hypothetical protein ACD_39C01383G0001 [uncultured bacterium]|nr:MAG: hypothetical protein ACD_39C01383G0001 [uncultured bacterium]